MCWVTSKNLSTALLMLNYQIVLPYYLFYSFGEIIFVIISLQGMYYTYLHLSLPQTVVNVYL